MNLRDRWDDLPEKVRSAALLAVLGGTLLASCFLGVPPT